MIIAITCVIAIVVIVFVLGVRPKDLPEPEPVSPFAHLDERKAAIYENLRDLQFEYRVGKLSDNDYQLTKKDLQKELAGVMAEVDRVKTQLQGTRGQAAAVAAPAVEGEGRDGGGLSHLPALQRALRTGTEVLRRVRQAHEGGARMRRLFCFLACAPLGFTLFGAVTGTVTNQTTGKPQAGATVALYKLGTQIGLELIDQAKSDAQGNFTINQTPQGPHLIRTAFDGVTYNHMLPPGRPTTGVAIEVYNASKQPGEAKVAKHMILFEPAGAEVAVNETYLFKNEGKTAWNDPDSGTLKFFLPAGAEQARRQSHRSRRHAARGARDQDGEAGRVGGGFRRQARRHADRRDLHRALQGRRGPGRQDRQQRREHVSDRAQRRHDEGRRLERSGHRAAHPGAHFWPHRRRL